MAEVLAESYKSRKLHPAQLKHGTSKMSSMSSHHKPERLKMSNQKPNGKLVANHMTGSSKAKGKSKDLEKAFAFIHGENLFPLDSETDKRPFVAKQKSLSEKKERDCRKQTDFVVLETKVETDIKMRVPKVHNQKQKLQNPERVPPLKDVKRRLDFGENDLKLHNDKEINDLDFTDKIAALRSLLGTGLKTTKHSTAKDTFDSATLFSSNPQGQVSGKHMSFKTAQVTRNDSLKENGNLLELAAKRKRRKEETRVLKEDMKHENDKITVSTGKNVNVTKEDAINEKLITGVSGARITEDRLSALTVDLHALKNRLFEKRKQKAADAKFDAAGDQYLDKFIVKRQKSVERTDNIPKLSQEVEVGDAMDHVSPDRKIISSTKKFKPETRLHNQDLVSSQSNLGHKEIQTDILNQSMKSVQSNVPFYEPYSSGLGEAAKRPLSVVSSSAKKKVDIESRKEGICEGVNIARTTYHLENSSQFKAKQTNVNSFVGTSLTPEKDKGKSTSKVNDSYHPKILMDDVNEIRLQNMKPSVQSHTEQKAISNEMDEKFDFEKSNKKDHENKIEGYRHLKSNLRGKVTNNNNNRKNIRALGNIETDKMYFEDDFMDERFAQRIIEDTNKTEKKVREWIKSQENIENFYPTDTGPMTLDELSVSISVESKSKGKQSLNSPDSCDRIPVKLEKWENERESETLAGNHHLTKVLPNGHTRIHSEDLKDGKKKNERLEGYLAKDLPPLKLKHHQSVESLDADSQKIVKKPLKKKRSSIFSLPFSVKSGESVSTTVQAVKLLRRLYNVDVEKRQNLVLMARCFRRWLNNVLHMKEQNYRIQEAARVSPISYGVMLRKGEICCRTYLLGRYFSRWKTALTQVNLKKAVQALQRKHMLQKGMNAFKWAINRSKLRQGILQDRVSGILLHASFVKWKSRAAENRRCRLHHAFARWRQFTKEAQKMCMLRNQTNQKLKQRVFLTWCQKLQLRKKQHKADAHFRMVLMSQGLSSWRLFTVISKEKKQRVKLAVEMYESRLQKQMFCQMKVELMKYKTAKHYHRTAQLRQAMQAWKFGSAVSKTERENDMRVAIVCWSRTTLRSHFLAWRDELLNKRACRMSDRLITKHTFSTWRQRYQQLIQQRESVDLYLRRKLMFRALRQWCFSVVTMKRKRAAAVEYIECVLQRHTLHVWHSYTQYQKDLRKRLQLNLRKKNLQVQKKYLVIWRSHFKAKLDEHRARQLWSHACARKAADKWQLICHRRSLERLLIDNEPIQQLNTQRVIFMRWKSAVGLIEAEKQEAAEVRAILDHSQLRRCYDRWKAGTLQLLTIKPMVLRYRQKLVTMCFKNWFDLVKHKRDCKKSKEEFENGQLRKKFNAWRQQYLAHQKEKDFNKKIVLNQARRCVQGWRFVIKRKHLAVEFHNRQLVQSSFFYWNTLTVRQLRQKQMEKFEYETEMSMKREYFDRWRERLQVQQSHAEEVVTMLQQQQADARLRLMFNFWRRHFRATLVARENEKIRIRRLSRQVLQAWHNISQNSLEEAVRRFAAAIGLHQESGDRNLNAEEGIDENPDMLEDTDDQELEPMNPTLSMVTYSHRTSRPHSPRTSRTPRTPKTPHTPRLASSCATPLRRLFSPTLSRQSLAQSLEFESAAMLSSSFLDARFEMEHAVKTESRREIVTTAITRLRHWPLSIIFDQWKEFTARQQEFKSLTSQMISVQEKLATGQYFHTWMKTYQSMKLAKQHYDQVLQHKALLSLVLYRNSRKQKKHLTAVARAHYTILVYNKVFPMWSVKAQEKHQREHIVHLWTNITPEEQQLIPRERSFKYQLNRKSLQLCFTKWKAQFCRITKLKRVYHKILLERYFSPWCNWALERHERHVKSEQFQQRRTTTLAFKTWCIRYTQKTEVARRYEDTWHNYLGLIVTSWSRWAKDQRRNCRLATAVTQRQNTMLVFGMFNRWKQETRKQIRVKEWYESRLTIKTLLSWQSVAAWQKMSREKVLYFRLKSYTKLAKHTFRRWHSFYKQKQLEHKEHKERLEQRVIEIARVWRCRAQETRGAILQARFDNRHLQSFFDKWKSAHYKNVERENQLEAYLDHKNGLLLRDCLGTWRSALMGVQAERVFNMKLVAAFVCEWSVAAKGCKQRRQNLIGYQKSRDLHTQKGYFLYWFNIAKARKSIRGHANLKIQLNAFKGWLLYTRRAINLRRLETAFTRRKNQKTLQTNWYTMKTRFHYCQELTNMADKVIREKNEVLMRQALGHWEFRLQVVIAGECYHHLLAKRVARKWHRLVARRREERQRELEQMEKAKKFYEQKMCNMLFGAWYNEVLVSKQIIRHKTRVEVKYGRIWKHKVDMMYTAKCVRVENLLAHAWNKWHMAFARRKAMKKVEAFQRRQSLTTVFVAWRNLCKKRRTRVSMIPLPVSPAFSMPSAGTSSSSTPTDEVLSSPTFEQSVKPVNKRSKLPSYGGRSSVQHSSGENGNRINIGRRSSAL